MILAGGQSRRLGRPKQLLDLGGRPLLQRTVDHVNASVAGSTLLVLGANAEAISERLEPGRATVIVNPDWADGQSTSMRAGLAALPASVDGALFVLGDQPLVTPATFDALIAAYRETGSPIVMPTYAGQPGNPVLFDRALWPELMAVTGDQGARGVIRAHANQARRVAIDDAAQPADVDDDAAYADVVAAWTARHGSM